jgi:hypothetical protein
MEAGDPPQISPLVNNERREGKNIIMLDIFLEYNYNVITFGGEK